MVAMIIVVGIKIRTELQLSLDLREQLSFASSIQGDRWAEVYPMGVGETDGQKKHDQGDRVEGQTNGMTDRWDISWRR